MNHETEENINKNDDLKYLLKSTFFENQRSKSDFKEKWIDQDDWKWIIERYDSFLRKTDNVEIIPKIIHQIWIGSKVPEKYDKWRLSWLKFNPDFKYILWDEEKILKTGLLNEKKFLQAKNPAIKSDIARYELLYKYGGIYVDTDFEAIKPIDKKLFAQPFVAGNLFEYAPEIANGFIMSEPKYRLLKLLIDRIPIYKENMSPIEILNYSGPIYLTKLVFENRELLKDMVILPSQYLYPWPNFMLKSKQNIHSWVSKKTISIHHWEMSWMKKSRFRNLFNFMKSLFISK